MTTGILWLTTQALTLAKISSDECYTCMWCYIIQYSMFYCHLYIYTRIWRMSRKYTSYNIKVYIYIERRRNSNRY